MDERRFAAAFGRGPAFGRPKNDQIVSPLQPGRDIRRQVRARVDGQGQAIQPSVRTLQLELLWISLCQAIFKAILSRIRLDNHKRAGKVAVVAQGGRPLISTQMFLEDTRGECPPKAHPISCDICVLCVRRNPPRAAQYGWK